ncbi:DinB family protein [Nocardia bovistercoris]|uniref:DinB family protein n=1 Tax=Nocardia bovistercoris TaxID=2785916 RepID=A0A931N473_9NOCA|nr:DinB family protein [Nocardia bovistercoris]MBH0777323.1 DinB family protein [Nocardia bovistercoris]
MPIAPDTKNWTWVLDRACPACGFDAARASFADVPALAVGCAGRLAAVARGPRARVRPDESTWSPLEYAAHVRDVCRIFTFRVAVAAGSAARDPRLPAYDARVDTVDGMPAFADWDQDATAVADRYAEQDPRTVAAELELAVARVAAVIAAVPEVDRERRVRRGDGSTFTVDSLVRYFLHDLAHHVHDVDR